MTPMCGNGWHRREPTLDCRRTRTEPIWRVTPSGAGRSRVWAVSPPAGSDSLFPGGDPAVMVFGGESQSRPSDPSELPIPIQPPGNRWDSDAARDLTAVALLAYRSNLLGSDRSVANWGGGNTSTKTAERDFRDRETRVLWVKGSGSDLATIKPEQFTALRLDDIEPLLGRASMSDEDLR